MAIISPQVADRVRETTTTSGTGTLSLGGAVPGFDAFIAVFGTGATVYYAVTDGVNWEIGVGLLASGTPNTLSRLQVLSSSNANALVSFSAASKDVFSVNPSYSINYHTVLFNSAVTAAGTNLSTATALIAGVNRITTASGANQGVTLPTPNAAGIPITVINNTGYPIYVYPTTASSIIYGYGAGSGDLIQDGLSCTYISESAGNNTIWVTTADISNIFNDTNTWYRAQVGSVNSLSVVSNVVNIDLSVSNNFSVTLQTGGTQTFANPTNMVPGTGGQIAITQNNATASTVSFGTYWRSSSGGTPAVSKTLNAVNLLSYYVVSPTSIWYTLNTGGVA